MPEQVFLNRGFSPLWEMRPVHLNIEWAPSASNRRSLANAILLITTVGYEIHAAAPISRSFINRLYNCAGKCVTAVKYSGRRATTNADNYRGRWISIARTPMIYRGGVKRLPRNCGKSRVTRLDSLTSLSRIGRLSAGAVINKPRWTRLPIFFSFSAVRQQASLVRRWFPTTRVPSIISISKDRSRVARQFLRLSDKCRWDGNDRHCCIYRASRRDRCY